ncbi:MAG: 6-phosphofructokinase [Collinsella sp.]
MVRIGLLTSGGDCQALNATMRGIVKTLDHRSGEPVEIFGFEDGYQGLIYKRFRKMTPADFSGILTRGGTILGTSRTPFKRLRYSRGRRRGQGRRYEGTYRELGLDCLFMLGGNGSTKTANRLAQEGLNVIALPKTIDNDTWGPTSPSASRVRSRSRPVHRRHPHHREQPRPRLCDRDHGAQGRLDPPVFRRRRRCGCVPDPRDPLRDG